MGLYGRLKSQPEVRGGIGTEGGPRRRFAALPLQLLQRQEKTFIASANFGAAS
jgi:hypothetical protein